tara:strand:+ start:160 stop:801 length:642 start_codon:yes stop_codon:yes gene_type:complete
MTEVVHKSMNNIEKWPLFISFYTVNTGYEKEMQNLLDSLKELDLPYHIEGVIPGDSWVKNCAKKPVFIQKVMGLYKDNPVVWVDADSVLKNNPELFNKNNGNYHINNVSFAHGALGGITGEILSGTLYIKNDDISNEIISKWVQMQKNKQNEWDQRVLSNLVSANKPYQKYCHILPMEYIKIFDKDACENGKPPVIVHYQASRRFKQSVNNKK